MTSHYATKTRDHAPNRFETGSGIDSFTPGRYGQSYSRFLNAAKGVLEYRSLDRNLFG
jgi:hypothetical protein